MRKYSLNLALGVIWKFIADAEMDLKVEYSEKCVLTDAIEVFNVYLAKLNLHEVVQKTARSFIKQYTK